MKTPTILLSLLFLCCLALQLTAQSTNVNTLRTHAEGKSNVVINKLNKTIPLTIDQKNRIQNYAKSLADKTQKEGPNTNEQQIQAFNQQAKWIMKYAMDSVLTADQKSLMSAKTEEYRKAEVNKMLNKK